MSKLTTEQIISALNLSEKFPNTIWYAQVCSLPNKSDVSIQGLEGASAEEIKSCVETVFPGAVFFKYSVCDTAYEIFLGRNRVGSLHLFHEEEAPAVTEAPMEIIQLDCTIDDMSWTVEEIMRNEA